MLRAQCESNQKKAELLRFREEQISSEYESFKVIFMKEIRNLKFDLEETVRQRNSLGDALIEFKTYFNSITNTNLNK